VFGIYFFVATFLLGVVIGCVGNQVGILHYCVPPATATAAVTELHEYKPVPGRCRCEQYEWSDDDGKTWHQAIPASRSTLEEVVERIKALERETCCRPPCCCPPPPVEDCCPCPPPPATVHPNCRCKPCRCKDCDCFCPLCQPKERGDPCPY
jgi:hypothetical protein